MVKKLERGKNGGKKLGVNRGAWTADEDRRLVEFVRIHGDKKWRTLPSKAGLNRCGKSCRLRWLNYLRPGIKRGNITQDEEDLILRLHNLLGNRWSLIAARLPGRTDNEIKNHWNTHLSKKAVTIDDLNLKINQKSNENEKQFSIESNPRESTPGLSAELLGFDMDFDQFFDFSTMPLVEIDQINDFGVEDYDIIDPNSINLVWDTDEGRLDSLFNATDLLPCILD